MDDSLWSSFDISIKSDDKSIIEDINFRDNYYEDKSELNKTLKNNLGKNKNKNMNLYKEKEYQKLVNKLKPNINK